MTTRSVDARITGAVRQVATGLVERGMRREAVQELAEKHRGRILASPDDEVAVRVTTLAGNLYPMDRGSPVAYLVRELYAHAPADVKTGGLDPEDLARLKAEVRKADFYW